MKIVFQSLLLFVFTNPFLLSQNSEYLSTSEVFSILQKSKLSYNILPMDKLSSSEIKEYTQNLYMKESQHVEYPWVVNNENGISLTEFKFDSLAWTEILKGEEFYSEKDYENALKYYEEAINKSDNCYLGYLNAGDCYLELNNPEKALDYYEKAKKINPYDYRCYFYCGTANMQLEKYEEAKDNYIYALSLKPNHPNLLLVLNKLSSLLSITVKDITFNPVGGINGNGNTIDVYIKMEDEGVWMPYILTKAMLKYEKEERMKYVGTDSTQWSMEEEKQALYCMLSSYNSMKEDGKVSENEYLEKLTKMFKDGDWGKFIIYEIASNMSPDVVLLMPEEFRAEIESFIRKYVIIDS